MMNLKRKSK